MTRGLAGAIDALYQAPLEAFVAERKRLAAELKQAGDADGAKALAAMRRPTVSAWAVDQLHWRARAELDAMFESAARLRNGEMGAQAAHRDATTALRARAADIIRESGHGVNEATLRKVSSTLAALAAAGGWAPDRPGALSEDREAPGFGGLVGATFTPRVAAAPTAADEARDAHDRREELARRKAERERLAFVLKAARADQHARERELEALRAQFASAEEAAVQAAAAVADLEQQLEALADRESDEE